MDRSRNERFLSAIESSNTGLWEWNYEDKTIYLSDACKLILNILPTEQDISVNRLWRQVHPFERKNLKSTLGHYSNTQSLFECTFRFYINREKFIWLRLKASQVKPSFLCGSIEKTRPAIELEDFRRDVEFLYNNSSTLILLKDSSNRVLDINKALACLAGLTPDEFKGKNASEFKGLLPDIFLEDERSLFESVHKNKKQICNMPANNGQRWLKVEKMPFFHRTSGRNCVFIEALDITREVEHEDRLALAANSANIGFWDILAETTATGVERKFWWSDSALTMLGYKSLGNTESVFFELMHPEDLPIFFEKVQQLQEQSESSEKKYNNPFFSIPIDHSLRLKHKNLGYNWYRCVGYRQKVSDNVYRNVGTIININDLKEAQEKLKESSTKLEHSNRDLAHFAYAASHDLRAPLRGLEQLVSWLDEDLPKPLPDNLGQHLGLMRSRVSRMQRLLADILAYSRAGRYAGKPDVIDLESFIKEIWGSIDRVGNYKLKMTLEIKSLVTHKTLLDQVLSNLISNAVKHHDQPEGHIHVNCSESTENYIFSIKDDGPGISPKYHEKIFEIFQTLQRKDALEGSGAGLAIVKKNIDFVNGGLWLESDENTRGCTFNFTLPKFADSIATL